jgi:hypothetical protein
MAQMARGGGAAELSPSNHRMPVETRHTTMMHPLFHWPPMSSLLYAPVWRAMHAPSRPTRPTASMDGRARKCSLDALLSARC